LARPADPMKQAFGLAVGGARATQRNSRAKANNAACRESRIEQAQSADREGRPLAKTGAKRHAPRPPSHAENMPLIGDPCRGHRMSGSQGSLLAQVEAISRWCLPVPSQSTYLEHYPYSRGVGSRGDGASKQVSKHRALERRSWLGFLRSEGLMVVRTEGLAVSMALQAISVSTNWVSNCQPGFPRILLEHTGRRKHDRSRRSQTTAPTVQSFRVQEGGAMPFQQWHLS
jgi:hypothetical protein